MPPSPDIRSPAAYVTPSALAFGQWGEPARLVSADQPLPTCPGHAPGVVPLSGTTAASGLFGPFTPAPGIPLHLTLTGNWAGSVRVERSIDEGVTRQPLTLAGEPWAVFTANASESVAIEHEAAARYYLAVTLAAGSLGYRISQ